MWLSEKYLLYQIYLIHLGCLCHSLRCADRQLWISQQGKWSCSHRISVTSHRSYASSCVLFPPFKSWMSSLLKELLSPPFLILEIQYVIHFVFDISLEVFFLSTDIQNSYLCMSTDNFSWKKTSKNEDRWLFLPNCGCVSFLRSSEWLGWVQVTTLMHDNFTSVVSTL